MMQADGERSQRRRGPCAGGGGSCRACRYHGPCHNNSCGSAGGTSGSPVPRQPLVLPRFRSGIAGCGCGIRARSQLSGAKPPAALSGHSKPLHTLGRPGKRPYPSVPIPLPGAISPATPGGSGARSLADAPAPSALIGAASRQSDAPPAQRAEGAGWGGRRERWGEWCCWAVGAARHGWRGPVLASRAVYALPGWALLRRCAGAVAHHGAHLCAAAAGGLPEPR